MAKQYPDRTVIGAQIDGELVSRLTQGGKVTNTKALLSAINFYVNFRDRLRGYGEDGLSVEAFEDISALASQMSLDNYHLRNEIAELKREREQLIAMGSIAYLEKSLDKDGAL